MHVAVQHIKFQLFPSQVKDRHPYWSIAALVAVHAAGMVEFPKGSRALVQVLLGCFKKLVNG